MKEPIKVTRKFYRQGTSFARGTPIDGYISEKACAMLYKNWDNGVEKYGWPPKLEFHGKVYSITGEMILETTENQRRKIYGFNDTIEGYLAEIVAAVEANV